MKRIVVGVTGASGMPLAVTLLKALAWAQDVETHLIVSDAAREVLRLESGMDADELIALADRSYAPGDFGAAPASGSWQHSGMVICPCSMATLAAVANGLGSNLLHRAADVTLKERRPLILVPRETPLSRVHLRNMLAADEAGAVIMPPMPGFYSNPATIQDLLDHLAGRILDHLGIAHSLVKRWEGLAHA
ncbi:MAG: UbiX family flavin prenyltransferase [Halodesulfovibrio sp.]